MVGPELWLLVGALVAFTASLWLVAQRDTHGAAAFARLADAAGWDHRRVARPGVIPTLAQVARLGPLKDAALYLAGPTEGGPFQLVRVRRDEDGTEWTLVHLRVARACRGLWIRPAPRFSVVARVEGRPLDAFGRRFAVEAVDDDEAASLLDGPLMAHLVRPRRGICVAWSGHDLVVAFPFGVRSPDGAVALVRYTNAIVSGGRSAHLAPGRAVQPSRDGRGAAAGV